MNEISNILIRMRELAVQGASSGSIADQLRIVTDTYVDPVGTTGDGGLLVARINGVSKSISDLEEQIRVAEERLERFEEKLILQFTALESTISRFRLQSDFLTQFLNAGDQFR